MYQKFTKTIAFSFALLLIGISPTQLSASETKKTSVDYTIDNSHSSVIFAINHLGTSISYGRFNTISGKYEYDKDHPDNIKIEISIDANSLDTNSGDRDKHLKNEEYFNVEAHNAITFKSRASKLMDKEKLIYKVAGDLTMLGTTKPVSVEIQYYPEKETKFGTRSGGQAKFTIKRSEFGMTTGLDLLSDEVEIIASIEGIKAK